MFLDRISQNPFIIDTISFTIFDYLSDGDDHTVASIGRMLKAGHGDRDYLYGILRRDLRWLYELATDEGKTSRAKLTLTPRTKIRLRDPRQVERDRWQRQVDNTTWYHDNTPDHLIRST